MLSRTRNNSVLLSETETISVQFGSMNFLQVSKSTSQEGKGLFLENTPIMSTTYSTTIGSVKSISVNKQTSSLCYVKCGNMAQIFIAVRHTDPDHKNQQQDTRRQTSNTLKMQLQSNYKIQLITNVQMTTNVKYKPTVPHSSNHVRFQPTLGNHLVQASSEDTWCNHMFVILVKKKWCHW